MITSSVSSLASGAARTLTAEIRDAAGNLVTTDNTTSVTFAKTVRRRHGHRARHRHRLERHRHEDCHRALAGAITIQATAAGLTSDTPTLHVVAGAADHLTFTSSTTNLGSAGTRTLTAEIRDAAGNVASRDNTTSSTSPRQSGAGTVTGTRHSDRLRRHRHQDRHRPLVGALTLQATAAGLTADSTSFTIDSGTADHLTITSSAANLASGATRTLTAEIRDSAGNVLTGDSSTSVTFAKTSGAGTVTGLGTATAASGVATKTITAASRGSSRSPLRLPA